jgi:hypothetical protein
MKRLEEGGIKEMGKVANISMLFFTVDSETSQIYNEQIGADVPTGATEIIALAGSGKSLSLSKIILTKSATDLSLVSDGKVADVCSSSDLI